VVAQSPGPGHRVRRGFKVNLALSKNAPKARVFRPRPPLFTG
jgi:beta-lactam-binding protein with PASTA domain